MGQLARAGTFSTGPPCDNRGVVHQEPGRGPRPLRLAILDDNPFVALPDGTILPRAATFHRFAAAVVSAGPFEPATYLVPLRDLAEGDPPPRTPAVDRARLNVVPTAAFDGIEGYLRNMPGIARRNWPVIRDAVAGADLIWVKAPASNGLLALIAARRAHRPLFTWVAGSARAVVRGQRRSVPSAAVARAVALGYDAVTGLLRGAGPSVTLDAELFTSVVTAEEVDSTRRLVEAHEPRWAGSTAAPVARHAAVRIAWAGRLVEDKGVEDLLEAVRRLRQRDVDAVVDLLGDGPDRARLTGMAEELGVADHVRWHGFVGERRAYVDVLRSATVFVLPSRAEGVPKVVVDAMAAGLPVIATRVGSVAALLGDGSRGVLVEPRDPEGLASAIARLAQGAAEAARLREAGLAFAAEHTIDAQAHRLVVWLRASFPRLPWLQPVGTADGGVTADSEPRT